MEYARPLDKDARLICVRSIAVVAVLVLGEMRPRADPGVRQHEEAHQPPPESEYIPFAVIERHIFREVPAESKGPQRKKHALTSQFIRSEERRVGKECRARELKNQYKTTLARED